MPVLEKWYNVTGGKKMERNKQNKEIWALRMYLVK